MTALTLPAALPGLLRPGSPVVAVKRTHCGVGQGCRGVATHLQRRAVWSVGWGPHIWNAAQQAALALDLEDPTGRAHATWWLAHKMAVHVDSPDPFRVSFGLTTKWATAGVWSVWGRHHGVRFTVSPEVGGAYVVPALASLDPMDPRLLPDGSRWVDAEALRLVCLEVGS